MEDYKAKDFGKLLKRNALALRRLCKETDTNVMRVYDRNLDYLTITVDIYGSYARITDYSDGCISTKEVEEICDIASRMLYIEPDRVIFHERIKRQGKEQHAVHSDDSLLVSVTENGLTFTVDLKKRIDTGLFLDQMIARKEIKEICSGMRVLNVFSYTGSFSVYAASGGASTVVSVDLSSTYTQWCKENLAANGFSGNAYPCISQDAAEYIREAVKERNMFDVIILDPPSFSNSRKMEHDFDIQRDYVYYLKLLHGLLVTGGKLYFSTNLGNFRFEKRLIHGYSIREITKDIAAPGFSVKKNSLRSWILEKDQDWKEPLNKEEGKETQRASKDRVEQQDEPIFDISSSHNEEDDQLFVLDWEDSSEESLAEKKNTKQRRFERRHPGEEAAKRTTAETEKGKKPKKTTYDSSRRESSSKETNREKSPRRYEDRPSRPSDRERAPRRFDDERRSPSDRERSPRRYEDRPSRPFDRERAPRRFDDERRSTSDRERSPRRYEDRPSRPFDRERAPRRFDDERRGPSDRERAPRRFDDERRGPSDRERAPRRYEDRPFDRERAPRRYEDRPFDRERAPRRFDDERRSTSDRERSPRRYEDRPSRPFDRERAPRRFDDERRGPSDRERAPRDAGKKGGPKPYGYDRFSPAKVRGGQQEHAIRKIDEESEK